MGPGSGANRQQAALNNASSGVVPDDKPCSTQPCPYMKRLRLGVFFDGTGNNKYKDEASGHETNVVRLFNPYRDDSDDQIVRDKYYLIGVGADVASPEVAVVRGRGAVERKHPYAQYQDRWSNMQSDVGTGNMGAAFGKGMKDRLNLAYKWVKEKVLKHSDEYTKDSEKLIDVYGFSRGAALARTFVNLVNQALPRENDERTRNTRVRFLGIYDTVASTGWPGAAYGLNLGLDSQDFLGTRHFTARDEVRSNFPLSLLGTNDIEYAGVHSDVGGSYGKGDSSDEKKSNWLAGPPCWDMYVASKTQGVEFTKDPKLPDVYREPFSPEPTTKQMTPGDVEPFKAECDKFDGTQADKSSREAQDWQERFVHDSTKKWYKGNWARTVDDTSKDPIFYDPESGMPIYEQIRKREIKREQKYKLNAMPPDFSWK